MGATVMPHAIFIHSWLTKNKVNDKKITIEKKEKFGNYILLKILLF